MLYAQADLRYSPISTSAVKLLVRGGSPTTIPSRTRVARSGRRHAEAAEGLARLHAHLQAWARETVASRRRSEVQFRFCGKGYVLLHFLVGQVPPLLATIPYTLTA